MAAPTIGRVADIDDDGSMTTGTVYNNAWKTALYNQIDAVIAAEDALNVAAFAALNASNLSSGTVADARLSANVPLKNALGTFASDLLFTDATYDLGKSGATRPRDGFFSRDVVVGRNLTPGTVVGDLLFTDATYDIGKSGATRPRDGFFSRNVLASGVLSVGGAVVANRVLQSYSTVDAVAAVRSENSSNTATGYVAVFYNSGAAVGLYLSNTAAWQALSDERAKTDILLLQAVDRLRLVTPRDFLWKTQPDSDQPTRRNFGFIAQEMQRVFPELVSVSPDGLLGVEYTGLIAPLVEGWQDHEARLAALESRLKE